MKWKAQFLVWGLLLTMLPFSQHVPNAQAANGCAGDIVNTAWNESIQRHALVPFSSWGMPFSYEDEWMVEEDGMSKEPVTDGGFNGDFDPALHPEEAWMYNPSWPLPTLEPLQQGQYITMEVGNDSVGALRMNLSSAYRTTFCISLVSITNNESSPVDADVYLMTSSQYQRYEEIYRMIHGDWWFWDGGIGDGDDSVLSDIPPEWRSFTPNGWQSYRDVHQYEQRSEVTFSVSMDGPEVYKSFLGSNEWQDFYLVIDTWDNTHDDDADVANRVVVADITVMPEARSAVFPTWTVPLVLFALLASSVIAPLVLNKRYLESGLQPNVAKDAVSVPHLEQASSVEVLQNTEEVSTPSASTHS
jgi:hypothetical protein